MDPISISSGIAGLITLALQVGGAIAKYAEAVREGPKNIVELKDELLLIGEILSQLQDFLRNEKVIGRSFDSNSTLQMSISSCKVRIERIGDKLKPPDGGRLSRMVGQLKWPFEAKEIANMITNMRAYTAAFQFALTMEGCNILAKNSEEATKGLRLMLETSQKIHDLSLQVEGLYGAVEQSAKKSAELDNVMRMLPLLTVTAAEVHDISHSVQTAELREQERRATDILDWLAPISALQKHTDVQTKRTPGTGRWFLEKAEFDNWVNGKSASSGLLCIGNPGAGKTVLTSLVIDHLRQTFQNQDTCVAFFYLEFSEQQSQTPQVFARVLLRQLCSRCSAIPALVVDFYRRTKNDVRDRSWFLELLDILRRVAAIFCQLFIVVDAFDETESREQRAGLLEILRSLRQHTSVKVFASLRPHVQDVRLSFGASTEIEVSAQDADLRAYLSRMIEQHPDSEHIMDHSLKKEILDRLCGISHGIFLLPVLQVRSILLDQVTKSEVRRALRGLSDDVGQIFQATINRIRGLQRSRRTLALKTLMWVSHAKRAFTTLELQHALAVNLEDDELDVDNIPSVRTILDSCFGLVEIDAGSSKLKLIHFTLEEYLRSDHGLFNDGDLHITRICLRYMTFDFVKDLAWKDRAEFKDALRMQPFLDYAASQWGFHARQVEAASFKDMALPLLKSRIHLFAIARIRDHKRSDFLKWKETTLAWAFSDGAAISLAASFGLTDIIDLLIHETARPMLMARNIFGSTPLHEAAIKGFEDTAHLLLKHGADLTDSSNGKNTPFYLAVAYGQVSMAKMLLTYGTEQVNVVCRGGWTALHNAADLGNDEMIILLLQARAQVDIKNNRNMTPLQLAARRGHLSVVRLMIQGGAAIHLEGHDQLSALDFAATSGHLHIAKFLLDNGANVHHKYGNWTAIHRAARGGHEETVDLLLKHGADLLISDHKGDIPLHLAARSGNVSTVKLMLDSRPQIIRDQLFAKDRKGATPKEVAFYTANYHIHKLLRAAERDVTEALNLHSADQLTIAIEEGQYPTVRRLLNQKKVGIETANNDGQPPLHVAMQEQKYDISVLLIEHGATIESVGFHGWRPLHIAASIGSLPLVQLCLDHGADIQAVSDSMQTPLHKACSSKSSEVVRVLLEAGADKEKENVQGMRPLHVAAHHNNLEVVRMLVLDWGVVLTPPDRRRDTPASWAERGGHLEILQLLTEEEGKRRTAAEEGDAEGGVL